jgi:hypothetical protein
MTKKIIKAINKKTKALFVAHKISKMNRMKRMIAHKNATKMRIGLKILLRESFIPRKKYGSSRIIRRLTLVN